MSSDAEREAERRHPGDGIFQQGTRLFFIEGAEWERSRPVSDEAIEAAARVLWRADNSEMETSWLSNRDHYTTTARAALEAAAKVRAQGEAE